ncbi:NAD-dependent epimerase/dehydratase family protein [uncultured Jannaschia sp.]|uniref:NAD-dependent epimerase/dehydratase family protein n=1 Tax=uncultured Jannaschia sp. TaxID=293347 RepID=UPI00261C75E5|nr:NAD-dependent epimerase/dehydratase family protein [uncultured Jannaschia sp.]
MAGFWSDRQVLVTGAGGFTGSHLARRLAAEGARVRAFVRRGGSRRDLPPEVEVFEGDLTDAADCARAVEGADTVFHVAAVFRQVGGGRAVLEAVHVDATDRLIRAARDAGCRRFVHTSTMGVHGHVKRGPGDETTEFSPGDDYQETKLEGELLARRVGDEIGQPWTVVRPCGIYGPGDTRFMKMIRPIARGRFVMIGDGTPHYHFVYIDDLVEGFLLAGEKAEGAGEVFLIGGPSKPTLNELARTIAELLGVKPPRARVPVGLVMNAGRLCEALCKPLGIEPPLHPRRVAFFTKNRDFDLSKAREKLGYAPKVDHREGFRRVIEWSRGQGLL